ncbi:magnetosome protein Mad10 [Candidatus Desulfarcum epimagneticum]|uniref:Magnetosome protein Mad10 n=1 Tax=uncultured Desulfobacteraceae bacterium TaxID=218296 RepID=A0A484HFU6_9BACT|nr:magnetosome protein Mad10 [uncultured Desulfobacteraceae bacterium]
MKKNIRYNLEHMGDSFAGLIQAVITSARDSAANVVDAMEVWQIKGKKKKKVMDIGRHSVRLRQDRPDMFDDEEIQVVFREYDELQDAIDQFVEKREERAQRARERCERARYGASGDEADADNMEPAMT